MWVPNSAGGDSLVAHRGVVGLGTLNMWPEYQAGLGEV
jgi:hypothetical protein